MAKALLLLILSSLPKHSLCLGLGLARSSQESSSTIPLFPSSPSALPDTPAADTFTNGCEFYGWVDTSSSSSSSSNIWNVYSIQLAGWGNDGTPSGCAPALPSLISASCGVHGGGGATLVAGWACTEQNNQNNQNNQNQNNNQNNNNNDNNNDNNDNNNTAAAFRLAKAVAGQPRCVQEAVRAAGAQMGAARQGLDVAVNCSCLAECWPSELG
ncbi:hypothetical protein GGR56DRAFT_689064 [Xylariaceae sp. FL0804]|nr:hypothetical protein GGR56DRAFT_689064 [Xylariaceae sp. FL0804]